jgi:hypothetical protein
VFSVGGMNEKMKVERRFLTAGATSLQTDFHPEVARMAGWAEGQPRSHAGEPLLAAAEDRDLFFEPWLFQGSTAGSMNVAWSREKLGRR